MIILVNSDIFLTKNIRLKGVITTSYAPNMNAYAERFIRSIRRECLDWFIIFSEKQLRNIIKKYMEYYYKYRHHQWINSIPNGKPPPVMEGKIKKKPILFGLHHHYYRDAS